MTKLRIFEGLKDYFNSKSALALVMAVLAGAPAEAVADTANANRILDERGAIYSGDNSKEANLLINIKDVLQEKVTTGELPIEYRTLVISPELTISGVNQMREVILNANFESLFTDPEHFQYLSMGVMYADDEDEKLIFSEIANAIQTVSLSPSKAGIQTILDYIRMYSPLLSVGGKQAVETDLFYLQALSQVYGMEMDQLNAMAASYGENNDAITYIKALTGSQNCR